MNGTLVRNYRILEPIGEGGMGRVYRAIDEGIQLEVAIKVLRPDLAADPTLVERFRVEAKTLALLNHPCITRIYTLLQEDGHYYLVMELVRGENLDARLRRSGALPQALAIPLFCKLLDAFEYAHRIGVIHRDIKAANIMLTSDGGVKIMDFGIARAVGSTRITRQGRLVGTPDYMAPEQVLGQEGDARSDIYALGILLYEILTGRVPFSRTSDFLILKSQVEDPPPPLRDFMPGVPAALEQIIQRALAKDPAARFQSAQEFMDALLSLSAAQSAVVPTAPLERSRLRLVLTGVAIAAVLTAAAFGLRVALTTTESPQPPPSAITDVPAPQPSAPTPPEPEPVVHETKPPATSAKPAASGKAKPNSGKELTPEEKRKLREEALKALNEPDTKPDN